MRTSIVLSLALIFTGGCITDLNERWSPNNGNHANQPGTVTSPTGPTFPTSPVEIVDADQDGSLSDADCNDFNNTIYPGAVEACNNVDDNCDLVVDEGVYECEWSDNDFDGVTPNEGDCDDYNPLALPGMTEECNGFDDDCNGLIDESDPSRAANPCGEMDSDGDGILSGADCNDADITIFPGALDVPYDGIDQDCDGDDVTDADGDGFDAIVAGGTDCDDVDPDINPGATEILGNLEDDDCNAATPDIVGDVDGDGVTVALGDCDDADATVYPAAPELCDGIDNDCNTLIDDNVVTVDWFLDVDGDGFGNDIPVPSCSQPANHVAQSGDCDDNNVAINPLAVEVPYDGIDQDCAGGDLIDVDCDDVVAPLDCDDADPLRSPLLTEVEGDGIDNDCDPTTLDEVVTGPVDADSDTFDSIASGGDDCNDLDAAVNPDATEILYNLIDEDCDGEAVTDVDGDGFDAIAAPAGTDCDDTDATVNPDATEVLLDGVDNDCDPTTLDEEVVVVPPNCTLIGTFTVNAGEELITLHDISGEYLEGAITHIAWTHDWLNGSLSGMTVTTTDTDVTFTFVPTTCPAADTHLQVALNYTVDTNNDGVGDTFRYDCQSAAFTGSWALTVGGVNQDIDPLVWDAGTGACTATSDITP